MGEAATGPLRASDAERDAAVDRLRDEFVEGRLSQDTFLSRMQGALSARRTSELRSLLADLPESDPAPALTGRMRALAARMTDSVAEAVRSAAHAARHARIGWKPRAGRGSWAPMVRELRFPPAGERTAFVIGRDIRCDLLLSDPTVSREHARLTRDGEAWQLTDLNSTNGTWVNGWRVRQAVVVRAGDRLRLGTADFILTSNA